MPNVQFFFFLKFRIFNFFSLSKALIINIIARFLMLKDKNIIVEKCEEILIRLFFQIHNLMKYRLPLLSER